MEAFQQTLDLLHWVLKDITPSKGEHSPLAAQIDEAQTLEQLPPLSPDESSNTIRLHWCIKALEQLYEAGFVNTTRFSAEFNLAGVQVQEQLNRHVQQLENGGDNSVAQYLTGLYTDIVQKEASRLTQRRFRRSIARGDPRNSIGRTRVGPSSRIRGLRTAQQTSTEPHDGEDMAVHIISISDDPDMSDDPHAPPQPHSHSLPRVCRSAAAAAAAVAAVAAQNAAASAGSSEEQSCSSAEHTKGPTEAVRSALMRTFSTRLTRNATSSSLLPSRECLELLKDVDSWNFDIFALDVVGHNSPLAVLAMKVLHDRGLIENLHLDGTLLANFFMSVERSYHRYPTVPYHNNLHGADVMHGVHVLLDSPILVEAFSDLELFAALVAGAVHDVDHPGRTNAFLVKTQSPLAVLYNDSSVLENHHATTAFQLMMKPENNFLSAFEKEDRIIFRRLVIDLVMSTDMARHAKHLGDFRSLIESINRESSESHCSPAPLIKARLNARSEDRVNVLCAIIHSSDLGGSTKPWSICEKWTERIMTEFWFEGDEERRLELEVGTLNDRRTSVVPKAQVGFINFVALPLWQAWSDFVCTKGDAIQLSQLKSNRDTWQELVQQHTQAHLAVPTTAAAAVVVSSDGSRSPALSVASSIASQAPTEHESSGTDCRAESVSPTATVAASSTTPTLAAATASRAAAAAAVPSFSLRPASPAGSSVSLPLACPAAASAGEATESAAAGTSSMSATAQALLGPEYRHASTPARHNGARRVSAPAVHVEWETSTV